MCICSQTNRTFQYLLDTIITVLVVWTLGPLFWITLGYVFDALIFPDDFTYSMVTSCVFGYLTVALFALMQDRVKARSRQLERDNR